MPLPFEFDFKKPDYLKVLRWRVDKLGEIRKKPDILPSLFLYYRNDPTQFIIDWGMTYDPRIPGVVPFLLFPKQEELCQFVLERWRNQEQGVIEKSRDFGASCTLIALFVSLCLFTDNIKIGMGSRKEEYVDKLGDSKALFTKCRQFLELVPREFRRGWDQRTCSRKMLLTFPETNSSISGECGDSIGRGDRTAIYLIDEAAHLERPRLAEEGLSGTTNCPIYLSTPRGRNNPFAEKRFSGKTPVISLHWRDDPRKNEEWYKKQCDRLLDPVIIAQELDIDYSGSVEGVLIPSHWVQKSIDAHKVLGFEVKGARRVGLDVADEGKDLNAVAARHGFYVEHLESWSGKDLDIHQTVSKVFTFCDIIGYEHVIYDADGLGAGVRGDAREINLKRQYNISFEAFRGSGSVVDPEGDPFGNKIRREGASRTNEDFFMNAKAQSWWNLRRKFQMTYFAITEKRPVDPEDIISISSNLKNLSSLLVELSQPTCRESSTGKILIDKIPQGARSPNLADAVMISFAAVPKKKRSIYGMAW